MEYSSQWAHRKSNRGTNRLWDCDIEISVDDKGITICTCNDWGDYGDFLLDPEEARQMADALVSAADCIELEQREG